MNFGYDPTPKDGELAMALRDYVWSLPLDGRGVQPYVEVNGLYPGVRVRRITHYSQDTIDEIALECDAIYMEVIEGFDVKAWEKKALMYWEQVCGDVCVEKEDGTKLTADQVFADEDACCDVVGDWLVDQGLDDGQRIQVKRRLKRRI